MNTKKHFNENISDFYHSIDIYNSLIYKINKNQKITSKKDELKQLLLNIENKCGVLNIKEEQIVFADGNLESKIMIIGDLPNKIEEIEKKPFQGENGNLLDKMLKAINLDRKKVYLTNAFNFLPHNKNSFKEVEISLFRNILKKHIAIIQPSIIFLLGSIALDMLYQNKYSISKIRGSWLVLEIKNIKIPVLSSFHPSFLIRHEDQKKNSWSDLKKLEKKIKELNLF